MVFRIFVEKRQGLTHEANGLFDELKNLFANVIPPIPPIV